MIITMLETELKCIINEDMFNKIKENYKWDRIIVQENHYYADTKGELAKNHATFRIRVINNVPKLQVKIHKNSDSPLQICEELEFEIDSIPETFTPEQGKKYTGLETGELVLLGSNVTTRYLYNWNENTEFCLDYNEYLDTKDYEIEVEYKNECPDALLDELKQFGVLFSKNSVGKYSRFKMRLREIMSEQ